MTVYDDVFDERFRDRLKLNNQTGSLTITNTTTQHTGCYKLQTNSVNKTFKITVFGGKLYILISTEMQLLIQTPFCFC